MGSCGRQFMSGSDRTSRLSKCGEKWRVLSVSERLRIQRGIVVGLFRRVEAHSQYFNGDPSLPMHSTRTAPPEAREDYP
jgi:hypothetical protein